MKVLSENSLFLCIERELGLLGKDHRSLSFALDFMIGGYHATYRYSGSYTPTISRIVSNRNPPGMMPSNGVRLLITRAITFRLSDVPKILKEFHGETVTRFRWINGRPNTEELVILKMIYGDEIFEDDRPDALDWDVDDDSL